MIAPLASFAALRPMLAYLLVQGRVGHGGHAPTQVHVGHDPRSGNVAQDLSSGQHVDNCGPEGSCEGFRCKTQSRPNSTPVKVGG